MDDPDPDSDLEESKLRPSRDRTRSREGDEAVVYVYVNGYGDEGPHEPGRSAGCMALTGCMSHPQF